MDAHSENLTRSVPFTLSREGETSDGLTLEGYGAVFNEVTRINDWEGEFDERIQPGAFAKTLEGRTPVLQFDHGSHPLVGSLPLGRITDIREDARGLFVRARLHDNWMVQPVRDAIASGSIDGMSFRFNVVNDVWEERDGQLPLRTITEIKLHEVGPVVFPAYSTTEVGVRSQVRDILNDPDARAELARALVLGTSTEPSGEDTPDEAALPDEPHGSTRRTRSERQRLRRQALSPRKDT